MLRIENVTKRFGDAVALQNVTLEVQPGELVALLGSSGSGKTTLLRCVAGIEFPDPGGLISIADQDAQEVHPYDRKVEMVFQQLGLFPFLSAHGNIRCGAEKYPQGDVEEAVRAAARASHVPEQLLNKPIQDLSGGERQRVALARSFAARPLVWLLDEPLSSVDVMLREELRLAILEIHQELKCATVYVTHDRHDAFMMADRVGILSEGELVQIGTPDYVHKQPCSVTAAKLTGEVNIFENELELPSTFRARLSKGTKGDVVMGIRPKHIIEDAEGPFVGCVLDSRNVTGTLHTRVVMFGTECVVHTSRRVEVGAELHFNIDPDDLLLLENDSR